MKVILLENLVKIGSIGDIIDVKRGFARNYLISSKKALYASKENIKEVEKIKKDLSQKDQEKKKNAKKIYEKINKKCPLSGKGAPIIDYKNVKLLKRYVSENGKILPSRITSVSQKKQRALSLSVKRARNLALI